MNDVSKKIIDTIFGVLLQSIIILGAVVFLLQDYVQDYVDTEIALASESNTTIKTVNLYQIAQTLSDEGRSAQEVEAYIAGLIQREKEAGNIVLDVTAILTAPETVFIEPLPYTDVVKN